MGTFNTARAAETTPGAARPEEDDRRAQPEGAGAGARGSMRAPSRATPSLRTPAAFIITVLAIAALLLAGGLAFNLATSNLPAHAQDAGNPFAPTVDRGSHQMHDLSTRIIPSLERQISSLERRIDTLQREVVSVREKNAELERELEERPVIVPQDASQPPALPGSEPPSVNGEETLPGLGDLEALGLAAENDAPPLRQLGDASPGISSESIQGATFIGCVDGMVMFRDENDWTFFVTPEEASSHALFARIGCGG